MAIFGTEGSTVYVQVWLTPMVPENITWSSSFSFTWTSKPCW